jgi:hypothetical protein
MGRRLGYWLRRSTIAGPAQNNITPWRRSSYDLRVALTPAKPLHPCRHFNGGCLGQWDGDRTVGDAFINMPLHRFSLDC